jgi:hypothetical protein
MATDDLRRVVVPLRLSTDEYLRYYRGSARNVFARDLEGRVVQFPAGLLRRFVTESGIDGTFEITITASGKLVDVRRLGPSGV